MKYIISLFIFAVSSRLVYAQAPLGFRKIFNGKNLNGWHVSRTSHQGTTPDFRVENGIIVVTQRPYGQGGILLTDKKYRNFELYLEVKIDSMTNGGIFIRSTESGIAYQVELDENAGSTGSLLGERMPVSKQAKATDRAGVWKANDWNALRIRMAGEVPHITLWINGRLMWDIFQPVNDFYAGAIDGFIGFQSHWTALFSPAAGEWNGLASWAPGAAHRYRNIAVKQLGKSSK
ncbi:MAG: DUF1080 domain-containing protein [Chitinophagaceae bacterium]